MNIKVLKNQDTHLYELYIDEKLIAKAKTQSILLLKAGKYLKSQGK